MQRNKGRTTKINSSATSSSENVENDEVEEFERQRANPSLEHDFGLEDRKETESLKVDDNWQAKFEDCKPGVFAAVHSLYDEGFGLCIFKVAHGGPLLSCSSLSLLGVVHK